MTSKAGRQAGSLLDLLHTCRCLSSTATTKAQEIVCLHESPYISIYANTGCQEPVLSHYKVCCNVVNCSKFPPDLFLKGAEMVPAERKTSSLGRTLLSFPGGEVSGF